MIEVIREAKRTPAEIAERITSAGGLNRYGEPMFRVVWGWTRLSWIGGKWTDRDASGILVREVIQLRQVPKYFPHDRWHLERWLAPELYGSRERWEAMTFEREDGITVPALGPFPDRGEYEHCQALEDAAGGFLPLVPAAVESLVRMIEFSKGLPSAQRRPAILAREAKKETDYVNWAYDVLDDGVPAFHGFPHSVVPKEIPR
jgi:hypothetical protein